MAFQPSIYKREDSESNLSQRNHLYFKKGTFLSCETDKEKMKKPSIGVLLLLLVGCYRGARINGKSNHQITREYDTVEVCNSQKSYLSRIDTLKPHWIPSEYCISITDSILDNKCLVNINVFDAVTGRKIDKGTAFFYGSDTSRISIIAGVGQKMLTEGNYSLLIINSRMSFNAATKGIFFSKNKKVVMNFYLGRSLQI